MAKMKKCKKHPTYKAVRPPRGKCIDCWDIWNVKTNPPPRVNSLVRFDSSDVPPEYRSSYPFADTDKFIYLGDIVQMPGHCILIRFSDGKVFSAYHTENFVELTDDET